MTDEQFETVLAAVADVQVAVDALGLDMQRVVEILAWTDTDSPQPPEWANGGAEDAAGGTEVLYPSVAYPPPSEARGFVGAAAGYVVLGAVAVVVVAVFVLFYLLGS